MYSWKIHFICRAEQLCYLAFNISAIMITFNITSIRIDLVEWCLCLLQLQLLQITLNIMNVAGAVLISDPL